MKPMMFKKVGKEYKDLIDFDEIIIVEKYVFRKRFVENICVNNQKAELNDNMYICICDGQLHELSQDDWDYFHVDYKFLGFID